MLNKLLNYILAIAILIGGIDVSILKAYGNPDDTLPSIDLSDESEEESPKYDENGFAKDGSYEPATIGAKGVYEISNVGQLYWFAQQVNSGEGVKYNAKLMNPIVVNEGEITKDSKGVREWIPIGNAKCPYKGEFNQEAAWCTIISGIYVDKPDENCVGLFGCIGEGGKIGSVVIENSYFRGNENVGGICGYSDYGTVISCINEGEVNGGKWSVGGICSGDCGGRILSCTNLGKVSGKSRVGGICGLDSYCARCINEGEVNGEEWVGGISGMGPVKKCINRGEIRGTSFVGGICGLHESGVTERCENKGVVTGEGSVGGIIGCHESGRIERCKNE